MKILNVGGATKSKHPLPEVYKDWEHVLLDITPGPEVDLVLDARKLSETEPAQFDAVWCSHNLEHYEPWDLPFVLAGFSHVLKPEGFCDLRVPSMDLVLLKASQHGLDAVLYNSPAGPIRACDLIWGYPGHVRASEYYRHRFGFTALLLRKYLEPWFPYIGMVTSNANYELAAVAYKQQPTSVIYSNQEQTSDQQQEPSA